MEDFEVCPGELSLLAMMGSQALGETDWQVIRTMDEPDLLSARAAALADVDPIRAEVLLHAWPSEAEGPTDAWAIRFMGERWCQVEEEMQRLRDEGFTASRTDVESTAMRAYAEASGIPLEAVLDAHGG